MSVNINAIEGHTKANSFATIDEADEYLNNLIDTEDWRSLSDDDKSRYLISASRTLNNLNVVSKLFKKEITQKLKYPIYGEENEYESIIPVVFSFPDSSSVSVSSSYDTETKVITSEMKRESLWKDENVTSSFPEELIDYTTDLVAFDFADNWASSSFMGLRLIEFSYKGEVIPMVDNFTAYASSFFNTSYQEKNAFDTSKSKIGSFLNSPWMIEEVANQRLIIKFDEPITFDKIIINNNHNSGSETLTGVKSTKIYIKDPNVEYTPPPTPDPEYDETIPGSTKIFDGIISKHPETDTIDDQEYASKREYGWDFVEDNTYSHLDSYSPSTIYCNINEDYIDINDNVLFKINAISIDAGSLTVNLSGTSTEDNGNFEITSENDGEELEFSLTNVSENKDIRLIASADFVGQISIEAYQEEEKYLCNFTINELFHKDRKYKISITSLTSDNNISSIKFKSDDTDYFTIYNGDVNKENIFYSDSNTMLIEPSNCGSGTLVFKIEEEQQTTGFKLIKEATIIQANWLLENGDNVKIARSGSILNYSKDNFGHGTVEKSFTGFNPWKEIAPGVLTLMEDYIETSFRIARG